MKKWRAVISIATRNLVMFMIKGVSKIDRGIDIIVVIGDLWSVEYLDQTEKGSILFSFSDQHSFNLDF